MNTLAATWRPIDDAPHGVYAVGGISNRSYDAYASHWMPLPPSPGAADE